MPGDARRGEGAPSAVHAAITASCASTKRASVPGLGERGPGLRGAVSSSSRRRSPGPARAAFASALIRTGRATPRGPRGPGRGGRAVIGAGGAGSVRGCDGTSGVLQPGSDGPRGRGAEGRSRSVVPATVDRARRRRRGRPRRVLPARRGAEQGDDATLRPPGGASRPIGLLAGGCAARRPRRTAPVDAGEDQRGARRSGGAAACDAARRA